MANSDKWKALARYLSCENVLSCFQSQLQASSETQVRACFGQDLRAKSLHCSGVRPCSHKCVFVLKRIQNDAFRPLSTH